MARQAWNRGMEPDRVVLEHIRALLLALAVLVDRAAGLPTVERLRFLAVLASGEAKARCLIVAMASDPSRPAGADRCGTALPVRRSGPATGPQAAPGGGAIHPLAGPAGHLSPKRGFAMSSTMFFLRTGQDARSLLALLSRNVGDWHSSLPDRGMVACEA